MVAIYWASIRESMIEALWSIEFITSLNTQGSGVAVLESGGVLGGDGSVIYKGSYKIRHGRVLAVIHVTKFMDVPGVVSFTGLDNFSLVAEAELDSKMMLFDAYVEEVPNLMVSFRMTRRGELPNP